MQHLANANANIFSTEPVQFTEQSLNFELHRPSILICKLVELGDRTYYA